MAYSILNGRDPIRFPSAPASPGESLRCPDTSLAARRSGTSLLRQCIIVLFVLTNTGRVYMFASTLYDHGSIKSKHVGKIGRIPKCTRDELGRRIEDGEPGVAIAEWLHGLPGVQKVLLEQFGGRPITERT